MTTNFVELVSPSIEETLHIGQRLGIALRGGEVIALIGPLGAGKTHLVKGIASGAGWQEQALVTSPTFVLINEYPGRVYLYHIDAYRLKTAADLQKLGIEEMLEATSVVIVEWADRVEGALPTDRLTIRIEVVDPTERRLRLATGGERSIELLARFFNE